MRAINGASYAAVRSPASSVINRAYSPPIASPPGQQMNVRYYSSPQQLYSLQRLPSSQQQLSSAPRQLYSPQLQGAVPRSINEPIMV